MLFTEQLDAERMVSEYKPVIAHHGLYEPVPAQWLHSTILRVGLTDDYTETEMLSVTKILAPKLASLQLPKFTFDSWWLWGGNVVLHITPDDEYKKIYGCVAEALQDVVGAARATKAPYGFVPHVTLAYSKAQHQEREIHRRLVQTPVRPATFRAESEVLVINLKNYFLQMLFHSQKFFV